MRSFELSVIIPTYNRKDVLRQTLEGYDHQTLSAGRFEVILVDDGSSDGTREMVEDLQGNLSYSLRYFSQGNAGPSTARNVGISKASGDILLIAGDDILPDENLLLEHRDWHREKFPQENVGVLGFVTWAPEPPPSPLMIWLERGLQFAYGHLEHGQTADWRTFYTCNVSLKHAFLHKTGERLDERFSYAAYEDNEWAYRLAKRGFVLRYNRCAQGVHLHWTTIESSWKRMQRLGQAAVALRHFNLELFQRIVEDLFGSPHGFRRALVTTALNPFLARCLYLPLSRLLEHRGIVSCIFAASHQYFFYQEIRKAGL